ncbi:MAG: symporter [Paludibacter sp. 47-17]|nr:MAG: symporter [Paludibacter sp. SCN 50-10]OJX91912.1 MAG: symporter [Paludibacter sp. 47-17]
MYEALKELDPVRINFNEGGLHILNIILGFIMFGVALGIRPSQFKLLITKPKSTVLGLFSQLIVLPAVTFLLVVLFSNHITPMVAMGMILVAACPGGNISNFISSFSRANTELSVGLTATTTLLATLTTPANFALWGGLYVRYINKHATHALQPLQIDQVQMFETVFILLGIPLIAGMLFAHYFPKITARLHKPIQYVSIVFFLAIVVISFSNNFDLFLKYIGYVFLIVLIHNGLALSSGYGVASLFGLPDADRRTLTIETGIQNSGLGLVLLFNPKIFPPELQLGGMLFITAWWGIWHIISGLTIASRWHRKPLKN